MRSHLPAGLRSGSDERTGVRDGKNGRSGRRQEIQTSSTGVVTHSGLSVGLVGFPQPALSDVKVQTFVHQHLTLILQTDTFYVEQQFLSSSRTNRDDGDAFYLYGSEFPLSETPERSEKVNAGALDELPLHFSQLLLGLSAPYQRCTLT